MKITSIGVNLGHTSYGNRLKDGGATFIRSDGSIVSLAEERILGVKHAGGFGSSLAYLGHLYNISVDEVGLVGLSSCIDFRDLVYRPPLLRNFDTVRVGHHLSHAYSAFMLSPFERALIVVYDAGGDILSSYNEKKQYRWWLYPREQVTCYIGEGQQIREVCKLFYKALEAGPGEIYRAFTHYLGWRSHTYSANTMALAAYGDSNTFDDVSLFSINERSGEFASTIENKPYDPVGMVQSFFQEHRGPLPPPLLHPPSDPSLISQEYKDLAAYVQREIESFAVRLVRLLVRRTGARNLCLSGGVALNCVANTKILEYSGINDVFIVPAAGDTGQSLGNALFAYFQQGGKRENLQTFSPYLGPEGEHVTEVWIRKVLRDHRADVRVIQSSTQDDYINHVARRLSRGYIVGWFHGRSEIGPRALGHRSIFADPRRIHSRKVLAKLRRIKSRELFRPFAPAILEELASSYFELPAKRSPYMLLVGRAKPRTVSLVPSVVHVDGSSRLQTVSPYDESMVYKLISAFNRLTGVPMLLNTSFNKGGEPIVETPDQALRTFLTTEMDVLAVEGFILEKSQSVELVDHYKGLTEGAATNSVFWGNRN